MRHCGELSGVVYAVVLFLRQKFFALSRDSNPNEV